MNQRVTTFLWVLVIVLSFGIFSDLVPQELRTAFYGLSWLFILIQSVSGINKVSFLKLRQSSLAMVVGLTLLFGINIFVSTAPAMTIQRLVALVINILIAYTLSIRSGGDFSLKVISDAFRKVLIFISILMAVIYLVEPKLLIDNGDNSNLIGTFKGLFPMKNVLGRFMVMAILFEFTRKKLSFSLIGLAFLWLIISKSATAFVAAATLIPLIFTKSLFKNRWSAVLLLVSMGAVLILFPIILEFPLTKLILEDYLGKSTNMSGRTDLWPYAIKAVSEQPWFGYGFSVFWDSKDANQQILRHFSWSPGHAHNGFIQLLIDFGLVGAIPVLFLYLKVSRFSIKLYSMGTKLMFSFCYLLLVFNFSQSELVGRNSFTFIFFLFLFFLSRTGITSLQNSRAS
ncbi:MAG: exopolysaccharide production protein ExoQ [Nitrospinales bacterium]